MIAKPDFDRYRLAAEYIREKVAVEPEVAVILGSSLGGIAELVAGRVSVSYRDIPGFLLSTNPSHAGKLVFGTLGNRPAVVMSGRFHFYEGYSYTELALPVRVLSLLGVKTLIVTNAAGGVNLSFQVGDIMVISDHIKLTGASPMSGPNAEEFGSRFFDVSKLYSPRLRKLAFETAASLTPPLQLREGVYYYCPGPQFETPAEIRAIRALGGDAVGMSTVTETLTAGHAGMEVLGFSLITNMAAGILDQPLSDEEVGVAARASADKLGSLIEGVIANM
ncbi:MAG TPA: purine-nucleoside phosphorylase [Bacillota bacterium]|nr:purine-nucleoside phosphorylase [Bacillota bacterium]